MKLRRLLVALCLILPVVSGSVAQATASGTGASGGNPWLCLVNWLFAKGGLCFS